jgi:insertion element IS1 protein InsB
VLESVSTALLRTLDPEKVTVDIERAGEAEIDEMWSFGGNKGNPCWLWHAIDHYTEAVLAYVFGHRQDAVFLKLQALLEPFGLTHYYTDHWGAYTRHLDPEEHTAGKRHRKRNKKVAIKPLLPVLTVLHLDIDSPTHHSPSLL